MTRFGPVLLAALVPLALVAQEKKDELKLAPFASKAGKFTVALPGTPVEKTATAKAKSGDIPVNTFAVDLKDRAFIVTYTDFAAGSIDADANKFLSGVIERNAGHLKGKLAGDEKAALGKGKHPARDIRIEYGNKQTYRARVALVGTRLYQVVAIGPDEFTKSKTADDFFKSFAIDE
ncbi:MAG: hypothetical protein FJ304_02420 [Planctomycetes bacterium]|nr:hypothetical protein [Planctomycetota bacterium]